MVTASFKGKYWFVDLPEKSAQIISSDNNVYGSGCDSCMLDKYAAPQETIDAIKKHLNIKHPNDVAYESSDYASMNNEVVELIKYVKKAVRDLNNAEAKYPLARAVGGIEGVKIQGMLERAHIEATGRLLQSQW